MHETMGKGDSAHMKHKRCRGVSIVFPVNAHIETVLFSRNLIYEE